MSDSSSRFENLTYDDFRQRAGDPGLTCYEKVGFPNSYRAGKEEAIFRDIVGKLPALRSPGQTVLDIGPGCSDLPRLLISLCRERGHHLVLADSREMLDQLPDGPHLEKVPCRYPDCPELLKRYQGKLQVILTYSVLHHVFVEGNLFDLLDRTLPLLAEGGRWLVGDVPNVSRRKRFFSAPAGVRCHQQFTGRPEPPAVTFNRIEGGKIDDAVVLGLLARARAAGYDAYVLPQGDDLPLASRREDLLFGKP